MANKSGTLRLAEKIGRKLSSGRATISGAESCTGGLVSQLITAVPGSSEYFPGAVISYSNGAKSSFLGVKRATLEKHGAVSAECAREMALGAKKNFKSDYAFSVTGIAGPGGGTAAKPVGLVYFGLAAPGGVKTFRRRFAGGREKIRGSSAAFILAEAAKIIK